MYSGIVDESDKKDSCNDFTARMMQMCLKSHSLILLLLLRILPKSRICPAVACMLGWSEKPKSWKSKNGQADY